MSLAAAITWGTRPINPTDLATLLAYIESQGITLTGTVGTSDLDAGAVTSAKVKPGPVCFGTGTRSGAAGSEIYTVAFASAAVSPDALVDGLWVIFSVDAAQTGATAQLQLAASAGGYLTTKYLKLQNGSDLPLGTFSASSVGLAVYRSALGYFVLLSPEVQAPVCVIGTFSNLNVRTNNALTNEVTVTADELILKDTGGNPYLASAVSATASWNNPAGAGGLDTGAAAISTWYGIWIIYKPSTGTTSALLALDTKTTLSALTLPSGYTYGALVGYCRNDAGNNIVHFSQRGKDVYCVPQLAYNAGTSPTSATALDVSAYCPRNTGRIRGHIASNASGVAIRGNIIGDYATSDIIGVTGFSAGTAAASITLQYTAFLASGYSEYATAPFETPIMVVSSTVRRLYWFLSASQATDIMITGFTLI